MATVQFPKPLYISLLNLFLLLCVSASLQAATVDTANKNPWTIIEVDRSSLPDGFKLPSAFLGLALDESKLQQLIANAPRETPSRVPSSVVIPVPLPDGSFAKAAVNRSFLMEPSLASQFPQIQTYIFRDTVSGTTGHMAHGPSGFYLASIDQGQLVRIDPVQTSAGVVYLSYFDHNRTDGANAFPVVHPPVGDHDDDDPIPVAAVVQAQALEQNLVLQPLASHNALQSGDQLRTYRLAAATTAELYQARGGNNLSVLFSIVVDLLGTNAVLESEVSTRLIIALASLDLFYTNANTDPFINPAGQCAINGNACNNNNDCAGMDMCNGPGVCSINANACANDNNCTAMGEVCNIRTTCELRNDNRDNMIALHTANTLTHDEYDLGVLFAVSNPGVRGGCAWYVVCLEGNTDHKARGMVTAGSNGTGSTSGVLAHEVGHMLGARHTFTGQSGSCTTNEFFAGNSQSGYEPGSGTTRMSYSGNCDSDNVDVSNDATTDAYFHSRSFDEIIDNVFSGDGASCGSLSNTSNTPPAVNAGADYSIPRMTPFILTPQSFSDDQPLTFNWEQYDRALIQRPIDTDFALIFNFQDFGPIIRSVAPTTDPTRTIPNLADLLDGTSQPPLSINRAGEMLPQVDRDLNFRFIARDNQAGGGGVAYDEMNITVEGAPFFITTPNGGEQLMAGCVSVATWQVGGSLPHASDVDLSFSEDGGFTTSPLLAGTPNDGGQAFSVPCVNNNTMRLKAQGSNNIFFDISDANFTVTQEPPEISGSTADGEVDNMCMFEVEFEATVADDCGVSAADVVVNTSELTGNATLGVPTVQINQVDNTNVSVTGSVIVSDLTDSPVTVRIDVGATDNCGLYQQESYFSMVSDNTPPTISVDLTPDTLWPPNHKMQTITANVVAEDNCPGVSYELVSVTSDEPDNGVADGNTVNDIQDADINTADTEFSLRAERAGNGDGRTYTATYSASDGSGNEATDSDTVNVPKSQQ